MLRRPASGTVTLLVDGQMVNAREGDSIAVALLANDLAVTRSTAISGSARGPYCLMGTCFDCLAIVGGQPSVQTCMTPVRDGMRIERQGGARRP